MTGMPDRSFDPRQRRSESADPLPLAIQRTLIGFVDIVIADLRPDEPMPIDSGVHDARKRLKRLRAILRLIRDAIGEDDYGRENAVLRERSVRGYL